MIEESSNLLPCVFFKLLLWSLCQMDVWNKSRGYGPASLAFFPPSTLKKFKDKSHGLGSAHFLFRIPPVRFPAAFTSLVQTDVNKRRSGGAKRLPARCRRGVAAHDALYLQGVAGRRGRPLSDSHQMDVLSGLEGSSLCSRPRIWLLPQVATSEKTGR